MIAESESDKFTQHNMYQILSQSARFCRLYIKKTFWCVFSVHSVYLLSGRHLIRFTTDRLFILQHTACIYATVCSELRLQYIIRNLYKE